MQVVVWEGQRQLDHGQSIRLAAKGAIDLSVSDDGR